MRAFLAIDLDNKYKKTIFELAQSFKPFCKGSFVNPSLYHITLFFFGDITKNQLSTISNILASIDYPSFSMTLTGIDYFAARKIPRVCFVKGTSPALQELFNIIEKNLDNHMIYWDKKSLKIHLTFLRIKELHSFFKFKNHIESLNKKFPLLSFTVKSIILYNSKLSKNGPEYFKVFIKDLKEVKNGTR
jgi:2'-5' RNA ligase